MAGWADGPFWGVDCESTGINPMEARIVELAIAEVAPDGEVLSSQRWLVDPGVEIPEGAAAVHGITTEQARAEGVKPEVALVELADWLYKVGLTQPVVGFNLRYDWPLILSEAQRHRVDVPAFAPLLDGFLIDRHCDKYRKGGRKLTLVAEHYGVELGDAAHGALADAVAAAGVMRALVRKFPELAEESLATLWLQQVRWHEEWREGFVDWKRRSEDPEFRCQAGWPIPTGIEVGI